MGESGLIPPHRLIDLHLEERIGQVVVAPDHVRDRHIVIIDHYRVLVDRRSVAAQDDPVIEFGVGDPNGALNKVLDNGFALARRFQSNGGFDPRRSLARVAIPPVSIVSGWTALGDRLLPHLLQFLGGAVAVVGVSAGEQFTRDLGVTRDAGRLKNGLLVAGQAQPVETVENCLRRGSGAALAVGVLDAQQELSAAMAGVQVVEQRDPGAANMQRPGGTWREASTDGHSGLVQTGGSAFKCAGY